jgi:hypothetical protein
MGWGRPSDVTYLEVVDRALDETAVRRVVEVAEVDDPDKDANDGDNLGKLLAKVIDFLLEWRLLADLRSD